jgi:hypothetical protein
MSKAEGGRRRRNEGKARRGSPKRALSRFPLVTPILSALLTENARTRWNQTPEEGGYGPGCIRHKLAPGLGW